MRYNAAINAQKQTASNRFLYMVEVKKLIHGFLQTGGWENNM
jgi:hypothetical protein